jgi:COMPASS component SPP1
VAQGEADLSQLIQVKPSRSKAEREVERLNGLLDGVMRLREELKRGMEMIVWREKLLDLAIERAENVGFCGWDQRLCFGEDEWTELGEAALDTYAENDHSMDVDEGDGDDGWWCVGDSQCERHSG